MATATDALSGCPDNLSPPAADNITEDCKNAAGKSSSSSKSTKGSAATDGEEVSEGRDDDICCDDESAECRISDPDHSGDADNPIKDTDEATDMELKGEDEDEIKTERNKSKLRRILLTSLLALIPFYLFLSKARPRRSSFSAVKDGSTAKGGDKEARNLEGTKITDTISAEDKEEKDHGSIEIPETISAEELRRSEMSSDPATWEECLDSDEKSHEVLAEFRSHYQNIGYYSYPDEDDVCLFLDGWIHTCASTRPHYHEVFVHYAARFVDNVERIIFIGGGDSKLLHEALKYPSLELAVGLEIDHEIARSSFAYFGTQPHFDNPKVEWYFGDAVESLSALPKSYYGSFDLVIVDLNSDIAGQLMVGELTLIETAMLLMNPHGIIVKNEEWNYRPGSELSILAPLANYAVDLVYHDIPQYCLQMVSFASNSVDFLTAKPVDHNIETLYLKELDEFKSQFDSWYNFGVAKREQDSKCNRNELQKEADSTLGVLMILEAEQASFQLDSLEDSFNKVLIKVGFTKVDSLASPLYMDGKDGSTIIVLAEEGYVTARCLPDLEYCAFDILLYGSFVTNMAVVKDQLINTVQSKQTSSYRFVLGGMFGRDNGGEKTTGPPTGGDFCVPDFNESRNRPLAKELRMAKGPEEFNSTHPASLHSYNNTLALKQWQSQRSIGGQLLMRLEVDPFWAGEDILVLVGEAWRPGQIQKVLGDQKYTIHAKKYEPSEDPAGKTIKKSQGPMDKGVVEASLVAMANALWELAEQEVDVESMVENQVGISRDDTGDGMTIAFSWLEGTLIISWDGKREVTANFFLSPAEYGDLSEVSNEFLYKSRMAMLTDVWSEDVFPRGISSVITFSEYSEEDPIWL